MTKEESHEQGKGGVGSSAMFRLEALRRVRECILDTHVEYQDIISSLKEIRMRRAVLAGVLEKNARKPTQNKVWVPPSSSVGTSKHSRLVKRGTTPDLHDCEIENAQAEYTRLGEKHRMLVLKRCLFIWRMSCVLFREMQSMLDSVKEQEEKCSLRYAYSAWMDACQPWIFDNGEVFGTMAEYRILRARRLCIRMLGVWRRWSRRRAHLRYLEAAFVKKRDLSLLKAAINQWRVYRIVHHMDDMRESLAMAYHATSLLKKIFALWKDKMSRRLLVQNRMQHAVFSPECCQPSSPEYTVDDLLFGGEPLKMRQDFLEMKDSIRSLKSAWKHMQPCLRWGDLKYVDIHEYLAYAQYVPDKYAENAMWNDDEFMNNTYSLITCTERLNMLEKEEQHVHDTIMQVSTSKIPKLQQRHESSLQRLIEYEKIVSEIQEIKQQLEAQVHAAVSVEKKRWNDYNDALETTGYLESLHASLSDSLEKSQSNWEQHKHDTCQAENDIDKWRRKATEHARIATRKTSRDPELTAAVKLKEVQSRLRQACERHDDLLKSKDGVWRTYQDALIAEKEMHMELERERTRCEQAADQYARAKENLKMLQDQLLSIDREYNELLPRLDALTAEVDMTSTQIDQSLTQVAALRASHEHLSAKVRQVRAKKNALEEDADQLRAKKVAQVHHWDTRMDDGRILIVQNSFPEQSHQVISAPSACQRRGRSLGKSHGEKKMLHSARSYHILTRAKACLSTWRLFAGQAKSAKVRAHESFAARFLPRAFEAWKENAVYEKKCLEELNARRMKSLFLLSWKRQASTSARHAHIVSAHQHVLHRRLLQKAVTGWRDHVTRVQLASDFACRARNKLKCRLLHIWRAKTARSTDLNLRCLEFTEKKEFTSLHAAFAEWKKATHHRTLLRRVLQQGCDAWAAKLRDEQYYSEPFVKTRCMVVWALHTHDARENRRLEGICTSLSSRHTKRVMADALLLWAQTTNQNRTSRREACTVIHNKQKQRIQQRVFSLWYARSTTVSLTLTSLHSAWTYDHPLHRALHAWMQSMDKIKRSRERHNLSKQLATMLHKPMATHYAWHSPVKDIHKDTTCRDESPNAISV